MGMGSGAVWQGIIGERGWGVIRLSFRGRVRCGWNSIVGWCRVRLYGEFYDGHGEWSSVAGYHQGKGPGSHSSVIQRQSQVWMR